MVKWIYWNCTSKQFMYKQADLGDVFIRSMYELWTVKTSGFIFMRENTEHRQGPGIDELLGLSSHDSPLTQSLTLPSLLPSSSTLLLCHLAE